MTLTTDRMTEIMVAAVVGKPTNIKGKEEEVFLASVLVDITKAKEAGQIIDISSEWEVDTT